MEEKLKATRASELNGQASPSALLNRTPEIKKIAEIILVYYIQRKVSNIFYVNLIDHIQTASTLILAQKDVIEIIDFLLASCSFWITSIPNKQGNIICIDKSVPLSKILAKLEKWLALVLNRSNLDCSFHSVHKYPCHKLTNAVLKTTINMIKTLSKLILLSRIFFFILSTKPDRTPFICLESSNSLYKSKILLIFLDNPSYS